MKTILIAYTDMSVGGSTTSLISMLKSFKYDEYSVDLALFDRGGEFEEYLPNNVNILPPIRKYGHTLKDKILKAFIYILSFSWIFRKLNILKLGYINGNILSNLEFRIRFNSRKIKKKYDIAIGYLEGWPDGFVTRNVIAKKKIAWIHTDLSHQENISNKYIQYYLKGHDKIICVSENVLNGFKIVNPELGKKAIYLPNIMSAQYVRERSKIEPINDSKFTLIQQYNFPKIISVCRYSIKVKGIDRMIYTARKLKEAGKVFNWYLIGDGTIEDKTFIENEIERNKLKDCFFLIGPRTNPYPYIKECDILALPSRVEGKPIVVTEGLMLGLVPVVTEYLSAKEQIKNGVSGYIVNNNEQDFFDKIYELLNNYKIIEDMKLRNYRHDFSNMDDMALVEKALIID